MRVFKVNDCDWVAAKSFDEASEWYIKEYGAEDDECWLEYESSLDDKVWVGIDDLSEEELRMTQTIKDGFAHKTYKWVMEHIYQNKQTPYLIASTEY